MTKENQSSIEHYLSVTEKFFTTKLPSLPENAKEVIVKFSPYLDIIALVFTVPAIFSLIGLSAAVSSFAALAGVHYGLSYYLSIAFLVVTIVLYVLALPGLFGRKLSGWNFMFYAALVSAVDALVNLNILGLIIGTGISLYVLYQIKSYYKN